MSQTPIPNPNPHSHVHVIVNSRGPAEFLWREVYKSNLRRLRQFVYQKKFRSACFFSDRSSRSQNVRLSVTKFSFFTFLAQFCIQSVSSQFPKFREMFPRNQCDHDMKKRSSETFLVKRGLTERLRRSAIPHMQRLLNDHDKKKRDICRKINDYKPVNNGSLVNLYH